MESGHTPSRKQPTYWDGDVPWVGIVDARLHHGRIIDSTLQTVTEEGLANSAARWLPARTVCLSRTASVGYVTILGRPMATSQDFVNWVCSEALLPEFLMYALLAEGEHLHEFGKGSTHTTIYFPQALAFHIDLPPLAEQRRIVAKVETLLARVNAARDELGRVPLFLKRFRQSVLAAACSGELTEEWREVTYGALGISTAATDPSSANLPTTPTPNGWAWATTESLCDRGRAITYGVIKLGPPVEGGVPTLRSSDVRPMFIDGTGVKRISRDVADQYSRTYLHGGEVLVRARNSWRCLRGAARDGWLQYLARSGPAAAQVLR
jgi:hypothetical protein